MAPNRRRPDGSLEREVLAALWSSDGPLTPGQVLEDLGGDLAYTTVMTVLTRLWQKDLVDREPIGRAFAYRPRVSEADFGARQLAEALGRVEDRQGALSRFVVDLTSQERAVLLDAIDRFGPTPS